MDVDAETQMFAAVANGLATETRRAVACTDPEPTPAVPRRDHRVERALKRLTSVAASLEPSAEPALDGLGDDVSSVVPRGATELSEHL